MHKMFDCERKLDTKITKITCISRQKIIQSDKKLNASKRIQFNDIKNVCEGCLTGIELYNNRNLKGDNVDENAERLCLVCRVIKDLNEENFAPSEKSENGFVHVCKECESEDEFPGQSLEEDIEEISNDILKPDQALLFTKERNSCLITLDLSNEADLLKAVRVWSRIIGGVQLIRFYGLLSSIYND